MGFFVDNQYQRENQSLSNIFNEKLKNFTKLKSSINSNPTNVREAAAELKKAYYGDKNGNPIIDNPTARAAWGTIEPQIEAVLAS